MPQRLETDQIKLKRGKQTEDINVNENDNRIY